MIKSDSKSYRKVQMNVLFKKITNNKCFCAPNQHIRIISEALCDI